MNKNIIIKDYLLINFSNLSEDESLMVLSWRNSELVRKYMFNKNIITQSEHKLFINKLSNDTKNVYYLIKDNRNNIYIGVIYLNNMNKNAYLGIYKNPEIKNLGNILIKLLFDISWNYFNLDVLKLEVIEDNKKAIDFYIKFGFEIKNIYESNKLIDKTKKIILMEISKK